eukprot:2354948-Rhodomonas_salina.2
MLVMIEGGGGHRGVAGNDDVLRARTHTVTRTVTRPRITTTPTCISSFLTQTLNALCGPVRYKQRQEEEQERKADIVSAINRHREDKLAAMQARQQSSLLSASPPLNGMMTRAP